MRPEHTGTVERDDHERPALGKPDSLVNAPRCRATLWIEMARRWRGLLAVAVLATVSAVAPGTASASTSITLNNVRSENRHVAASFALGPYAEVWGVQVATQPTRGTEGTFLTENVVIFDFWGSASGQATQYLSEEQINVPGTYYVMALGYDDSCFVDILLDCGPLYSDVVPVTIEPPPPAIVITSAKSVKRHLLVRWTLSPTAEVWGLQVARSPALTNDHNFRSPVVLAGPWGETRKRSTSYRTPGTLKRGTYYVLVYGYDLGDQAYSTVQKVVIR